MPFEQAPNRMLSTQEAATLMGLQPCTLLAWREDGSQPDLAVFKIGKAVGYRYGDVIGFINAWRAVSTLAARELKSTPAPARADDSRSPELQIAGDQARRKKAAPADPGIDGQTSFF
jgi:hypothetical protein